MSKKHPSPLLHDFTKPDMPNVDSEAIEGADLSVWDCVSDSDPANIVREEWDRQVWMCVA